MVDGSTFSPAESDTKNEKGIIHRQMVKYARTFRDRRRGRGEERGDMEGEGGDTWVQGKTMISS
jgi:hypothetical protein